MAETAAGDGLRRALVLFSGGQDSTTCLAWALTVFDRVDTVGFDYGQRHKSELTCRKRIREIIQALNPRWQGKLGEDHILNLTELNRIADCALTRSEAIGEGADGLPNTFVPGRNLLFFNYAAILAWRLGIRMTVIAMRLKVLLLTPSIKNIPTKLTTNTNRWTKQIRTAYGTSRQKRQRNIEPLSVKCVTKCMLRLPSDAASMTVNTKTEI